MTIFTPRLPKTGYKDMTDFWQHLHFDGLLIGISTFVIIGLLHPAVIKGEYYFGVRIWRVFLALGLLSIAAALSTGDLVVSTLLGVFGFSCLWSIKEVFEQQERVRKGWFPRNPRRRYPFDPQEPDDCGGSGT